MQTEAVYQRPIKADEWTLAHGFYGSMGGFAIDLETTDESLASLFGDHKRLTLTARGVALLAKCGHIPDISDHEIRDKNKADGLAKLLVCIQAGWMIVQVISRAATGLATTLLEVHTVAHVVCALVMYVIWWHKPRQVESPTLLKGDCLWPLVMYMFLASRMSAKTNPRKRGSLNPPAPELQALVYVESPSTRVDRSDELGSMEGCFRLRDDDRVPASPVAEDDGTARQRQLAARAVSLYPALRSQLAGERKSRFLPSAHYELRLDEYLQPYAVDWPNAGLLRRTQSLVMGMTLWGASMAFGAIHVAAWDYFFPTSLEQLFWHLSSVWVTFCAAFWLMTNMLAHLFPVIDHVWIAYNKRKLNWCWFGVITFLCILCGASYIVSRAYLVIEAFVSIRLVPSNVYQTPAWSQIFPHL